MVVLVVGAGNPAVFLYCFHVLRVKIPWELRIMKSWLRFCKCFPHQRETRLILTGPGLKVSLMVQMWVLSKSGFSGSVRQTVKSLLVLTEQGKWNTSFSKFLEMNRSQFSAGIHLWFQRGTHTQALKKRQFCVWKSTPPPPPHHNTQEQHITAIRFHTSSYDNSFECQTYVGSETRRRKYHRGKGS